MASGELDHPIDPFSVDYVWNCNRAKALAVIRKLGLDPPHGPLANRIPHRPHYGSEAEYPMEYTYADKLVLVQYLAPHKTSSIHYHPPGVTEEYLPLLGRLFINGVLLTPFGRVILSGEIHQVSTQADMALTLIVMSGVDRFEMGQLHIRLDKEKGRTFTGRSAFGYRKDELPILADL